MNLKTINVLAKNIAKNAPKILNNAINSPLIQTTWNAIKNVKPSTWAIFGGGIFLGGAGMYLLRQPEVNELKDEAKKAQSEVERLQIVIRSYHNQFIALKVKLEALEAKTAADAVKQGVEDSRTLIMYQYATKEYIELCLRPRDVDGSFALPEKEYYFYKIFKRVLNGEKLDLEDAKKLRNYVLPKYQKEIEDLVEYDFSALMQQLALA